MKTEKQIREKLIDLRRRVGLCSDARADGLYANKNDEWEKRMLSLHNRAIALEWVLGVLNDCV